MKRLGRNLTALVLVGALGAGAYLTRDRWLHAPAPQTAETAQQQPAPRQGGRRGRFGGGQQGPVAVLVAPAAVADVPVHVDGVGTAQPLNTVTVRPQVDGRLVALSFREGQDVRKGDLLARIDDRTYRAQLDQALAKKAQDEATLQNARRDLERYTALVASNSVTRQQADTQRAVVAQTEALLQADDAAIEAARITLGYTEITAPIDGRTGIRMVDEGNLLQAGDTTGIVTISQIRPIAVLFTVPQQQLGRINRASAAGPLPVEVLDEAGKASGRGTLQVIDNQVDQTTGTVRLKAVFPNDDLALWPGAFVNARLLVDTLKGVIVVPTPAIQRGPDGTFVYRLKPDQTVAVHPVTVGQQDDRQAVVTAGLAAGDRVVTTGFARLTDGAKVQVSGAGEEEGGPTASAAAPARAAEGGRPRRQPAAAPP